jgi:hypothetical protein
LPGRAKPLLLLIPAMLGLAATCPERFAWVAGGTGSLQHPVPSGCVRDALRGLEPVDSVSMGLGPTVDTLVRLELPESDSLRLYRRDIELRERTEFAVWVDGQHYHVAYFASALHPASIVVSRQWPSRVAYGTPYKPPPEARDTARRIARALIGSVQGACPAAGQVTVKTWFR